MKKEIRRIGLLFLMLLMMTTATLIGAAEEDTEAEAQQTETITEQETEEAAQEQETEVLAEATDEDTAESETAVSWKITLEKKKLTLYTGEKEKINATVKAEDGTVGKLSYTTSNEKIAAVSQKGNVTAVKAGTATITVSETTTGISKKVTVKVKAPTLKTSAMSLEIGKSQKVEVKVTPSSYKAKLTYESKNPSIATVSAKGKVTAVKAGSTKIVITDKISGVSVKAAVKVKKPTIQISGISSFTIKKLDKTYKKLTYKTVPASAEVSFSSSNEDVAVTGIQDWNGKTVVLEQCIGQCEITGQVEGGNSATWKIKVQSCVKSLKKGTTISIKKALKSIPQYKKGKLASSDSSVVSVSKYKLTAKGKGTAKVTFTVGKDVYTLTCYVK